MKLYVVTDGEYSDYHVVGIFSSYEKAKACGDGIYVTTLDEPDEPVGAWGCYVVVRECRSYDSAPANLKLPATLTPGMILQTEFYEGIPVEKEMRWYTKGRVAILYALTEEGAKRKAADYAAATTMYAAEDEAYTKYMKQAAADAACASEGHLWIAGAYSSSSSIGAYTAFSCHRCGLRENRPA